MNARLRALQRRGQIGVVVFAVLTLTLYVSMVLGADYLAWCIAPFAGGSFTFTLRTIVIVGRLRVQLDREADERAQEKVRRARLHRLAAPDATGGQCPVCGYDDLDQLAAVDEELEEPGSRFTRVVPYGARRAHQECAELVPYQPTEAERLAAEAKRLTDAHETDHHGTPLTRVLGCPVCAQETREQIANDPDVGRPIWPPLGVTYAELSQRLTNLFSVPPADVGPMRGPLILPRTATYTPLQDADLTARELRAQIDRELRHHGGWSTVDGYALIGPTECGAPGCTYCQAKQKGDPQ